MKKTISILAALLFFQLILSTNITIAQTWSELNANLVKYYKTGDNKKAILFGEKAKIQAEKEFGKNHKNYATSCNNLAGIYYTTGNYSKAESLFIDAKKTDKKILGKNHPDYAVDCNNLGLLYSDLGNHTKAEELFIEALKIEEKLNGKLNLSYAKRCNNLAGLYEDMGRFNKAELLYIEAIKIKEKVLGKQHPSYATSCNNLAGLYVTMGNYIKAEPLYNDAKNIYETIYGKNHSSYATSCNNLAFLFDKTKQYEKAVTLYIEAKNIREQIFGKQHPEYAQSLNNLGGIYYSMGKYSAAEPIYIEANAIMNFLSSESEKFMSEKEREKYLNTKINYNYDAYHSLYLIKRNENKKLVGNVYNNALHIKGQLLRSATTVRKVIQQSGDSSLIHMFDKMNNYGKVLVKEYSLPIHEQCLDIKDIEKNKNILEKELILKSQNFAKVSFNDKIKWEKIQNSLKKNETAIEFIHFNKYNNKGYTESILFFALILRKDFKYPKAIYLFEQNQLEKILKRPANTNVYNYIKELYSPKSIKANILYHLVWYPFEQFLQNTENVYISSSGILNNVAFDAISDPTGNLLSDKYKIIYTTSTSQIVSKNDFYTKGINTSALFGGIEYKINPEEMEELASKLNKKSLTTENKTSLVTDPNLFKGDIGFKKPYRNISWSYLPGSLEETKKINDILNNNKIDVQFYKNKQGSEEQFKILEKDAPTIIHVSTHGFYFIDDKKNLEKKSIIKQDVIFKHADNPLLRSGFILAGGNNAFQGKEIPKSIEDGVLTAAEISRLNFFKTKLVVLSACQTGLGDVKGNEGVYGLQRAFKMAGVEYLLFSLWEVPDDATQELMVKFYEYWFSGLEIRDAFKKAQEHLKEKYKDIPGAAFAWAAFVLMK